jgi:deazaflavin-dependent oxidoreductase (nitroreductase family)
MVSGDAAMDSRIASQLARAASYKTMRLTHRGRKSCNRYEVTIWFVVDSDAIYLNGNAETQWPRNLQANPQITMRIGQEVFHGKANLVTEPTDRERIFAMIARKYWYAFPFIWTLRWLERNGFTKDRNAAFRVQVEAEDRGASSN